MTFISLSVTDKQKRLIVIKIVTLQIQASIKISNNDYIITIPLQQFVEPQNLSNQALKSPSRLFMFVTLYLLPCRKILHSTAHV